MLAVLLESTTELLATPEDDEARLEELRESLSARLMVVLLGAQTLARPVRAARSPRESAAASGRGAAVRPVKPVGSA
jgi:hypothetical protein